MSGEQPADPYTHWRSRAETAETRVAELEHEVQRLNMEMDAYRHPCTAKDAAAMLAVIDALQTAKQMPATCIHGYPLREHCDYVGPATHDPKAVKP